MVSKSKKIKFNFGEKHLNYIRKSRDSYINVAEGAVRAGKTVDNVFAFAYELDRCRDKIHLATGSTVGNAKMNIGECNGLGLEYIFRGRSHWGKFKSNEALFIRSFTGQKIVIFAGGMKENSFKSIRGNSYGMWIATEINLHHDNTIKEAFNRQLMAKDRKVFWDLNPSPPKHRIYSDYIDKYKEIGLEGYNYERFTIFDNINLTEERKQEIIQQYDKESIWYKRDIKGERLNAEGLIYRLFANNPDNFLLDKRNDAYLLKTIALDFGGNNSNHALVASGITIGHGELHGLKSSLRKASDTDSTKLCLWVVEFVKEAIRQYGSFDYFYYDNAEPVLGRTVEKALIQAGLNIVVKGAWKIKVNERIRATDVLMTSGRFKYTEDALTLKDALSECIWDPKSIEIGIDERLDDGTTDIDTLDAFEYTFERQIKRLIVRR